MPQLQLHQLRVASVASIVMNCFRKPLDKNTVITACLLHDMGNIIKFDLGLYPKYLKGRGLAYWEGVQNKFKRNYGEDEHKATYKICNEIGVNDKVKRTIKAFGFSNSKKIYKSDNFEVKIGSLFFLRAP